MGIGKHLHLNVAAALDQALQHQGAVAKCAIRLAPGGVQRSGQLGQGIDPADTTAATTGHGFHQERESQPGSLGRKCSIVLRVAQVTGRTGHPGGQHAAFGLRLVTHGPHGGRRRADEHQAGIKAGLGKIGVLAQKTVARVHRVGTGLARGGQQGLNAQVRLGGRRRADAHCLVGQLHMGRIGIGIAEHRHSFIAQVLGAADDAAGNFAAVGDQDSRKAHSRATPKVLGRSCRACASSASAKHRPR